MVVMRYSSIVCITAAALVGTCCRSHATMEDIVGAWVSSDGAVMEFRNDGRFSASNVPAGILFGPDHPSDRLGGVGKWHLAEGSMGTEVELEFDSIGEAKQGFGIAVRTSGRGDSLRLFFWVTEPGGERYEFRRK